jgi:two-component system, chemotaxis family, CheB/CheR fusion protein
MKPDISMSPPTPPTVEQDFPIVGIGASAGGLDAFKKFLKAIPEDSGMAYVLVQHLDPSHQSLLPEILSKTTKVPVNEITDDIHLAPNNIYVIPENKILTSSDGVLNLTSREKIKRHYPIDVFFTSLAEVHQSLAVGVVLSGTASDGTLGLKAIKAHGGITFAQDQESAAYGSMPQNAVNAEAVDFVLPPEKIPEKLLQILHTYKGTNGSENHIPKNNELVFQQIVQILSKHSGVDFNYYKQTTIRRRIARRMAIVKKENLSDYLKFIRQDKPELDELFNDVLLPVTSFFRDPQIFDHVNQTVFPVLVKNNPSNPLRIWIAGCSTGEEAYTFAIALQEFFEHQESVRQLQIFATDISKSAIAKARTGTYNSVDLKNLSDDLLKKYFTKVSGNYQVNRQTREMCIFTVHNFLKDPAFVKIDLVSCRNVLIYMDPVLQKKALNTFHYALKDSGILLLGKSETTGPASEYFLTLSKDDKIYTRKAVPSQFVHVASERKETLQAEIYTKASRLQIQQPDFRKSAESILLSRYTPACVIINELMDIVHIQGSIAPFLQPPQGKPTYNLLQMAREGLAFELRNVFHKSKSTNERVEKEGILIESDGKSLNVTIEILPLTNTTEPYFLVLFYKYIVEKRRGKFNGGSSKEKLINDEAQKRIEHLEKELAQTREDVRAITEDQEAANEELQSMNEELLSSNEEMQSLNEEMETSKEELQSTNEELTIVNQELLDKQEQITASQLYAEAIIATVKEPLAVLDHTLSIKTLNVAFCKQFNITEQEAIGELIYHVKGNIFDNAALQTLLEKVIPQKKEVNNYEIKIKFPENSESTMMVNARPVINKKNTEQLVLLTIIDITEEKTAQQHMISLRAGLEAKVKERTAALELTNMQLEQFAHTASHELQEPLRKITTFAKILKRYHKNGKPEDIEEYLDKMEDSAIRMTQLIQHLLDFASVTQPQILYQKIDLNEIFKIINNDFELLISEKKAVITKDKLPEIEGILFQMYQVFYDLISNSLKFSKKDVPPRIHISAKKLTKKKIKGYPDLNQNLHYYELIFKDNSIGFDQKYAQQIFAMFQRLDITGSYPGTGIGLALCKKIVRNYQGEIFAVGQRNEGSEFHILLPVMQTEQAIENLN